MPNESDWIFTDFPTPPRPYKLIGAHGSMCPCHSCKKALVAYMYSFDGRSMLMVVPHDWNWM